MVSEILFLLMASLQARENIPMHPEYGVPNFDNPASALEWPRFRAAVTELKTNPPRTSGTLKLDSSKLEQDLDLDKLASVRQFYLTDQWL